MKVDKFTIASSIIGIFLLHSDNAFSTKPMSPGEIQAKFGSWQESEGTITLDITVTNIVSFFNTSLKYSCLLSKNIDVLLSAYDILINSIKVLFD